MIIEFDLELAKLIYVSGLGKLRTRNGCTVTEICEWNYLDDGILGRIRDLADIPVIMSWERNSGLYYESLGCHSLDLVLEIPDEVWY